MKTALTIAGTDPSGGAGIQADIKTMTAHGVFAMSAITALVAQNTSGVRSFVEVSPDFLAEQLQCVFTDIFPDAVKTGMVASVPLIRVIAEQLAFFKAPNLVVDPVMVATSGDRLISEDAIDALTEQLLPLATLVTPNVPEAEILSGMAIHTMDDLVFAGKTIHQKYGCAVLCKGGHNVHDADDVLIDANGSVCFFLSKRVDNPNTHGTGCTLSSAIASNLARGFDLETSIQRAKKYVFGALSAMLDLGHGSGPLDHSFDLSSRFIGEGTP